MTTTGEGTTTSTTNTETTTSTTMTLNSSDEFVAHEMEQRIKVYQNVGNCVYLSVNCDISF